MKRMHASPRKRALGLYILAAALLLGGAAAPLLVMGGGGSRMLALAGARAQSQNGFKVELAKRCLMHALRTAAA